MYWRVPAVSRKDLSLRATNELPRTELKTLSSTRMLLTRCGVPSSHSASVRCSGLNPLQCSFTAKHFECDVNRGGHRRTRHSYTNRLRHFSQSQVQSSGDFIY